MKSYLPTSSQSGQILVAVVLTMVISLIVGLAVSSRSLSSLRGSTYTSQSTAAFHAAEAAVEDALNKIDDKTIEPDTDYSLSESLSGTGSSFNYSVVTVGGGSLGEIYVVHVERDDTVEVKLGGYEGGTLDVYWDDTDTVRDSRVAMLITLVDSADNVTRYAYDTDATRSNGFDKIEDCAADCDPVTGGYTYWGHTTLTLPSSPALMRLTPMYESTPIAVKPAASYALPAQAYVINATGQSGQTNRSLEVTRSLPALPPIFNFAIYSGSETSPLSK